jgi:ABC-type transport system involved in cytochrome c biogenesis ATPase subunit
VHIHSVESERIGFVRLSTPIDFGSNRVTVLTGPNGSGKTEVLTTIANVFHGRFHERDVRPACVAWDRDGFAAQTTYKSREVTGTPRVVAQTFSPFSRFPGPLHRHGETELASVLRSKESRGDEYIGIGFDHGAHVKMEDFSRLIVENGLLKLSEEPKAARAVLNVLRELEFKEGMLLQYRANRRLDELASVSHVPGAMEQAFQRFASTGVLDVQERRINTGGRWSSITLSNELRLRDVHEVAEYVRGALELIRGHLDLERSRGNKASAYRFRTFEEFGMVGDFSVLQAFSVLRRLGLLTLIGCRLTPIGGKEVDVASASSGQQQLLCSFFGLAAALEDEAVVLIDEPELSLHPRWQMNFLRHLESVLEPFRGCHVIVATHSPLIAQSAIEHNAQIVHLAKEAVGLPQSRNGDKLSVEEALISIFETPVHNSLHVSNQIFELVSKAEAGSHLEKLTAKTQLEAYLDLYRRHGEGSSQMIRLLEKALRLISFSAPTNFLR